MSIVESQLCLSHFRFCSLHLHDRLVTGIWGELVLIEDRQLSGVTKRVVTTSIHSLSGVLAMCWKHSSNYSSCPNNPSNSPDCHKGKRHDWPWNRKTCSDTQSTKQSWFEFIFSSFDRQLFTEGDNLKLQNMPLIDFLLTIPWSTPSHWKGSALQLKTSNFQNGCFILLITDDRGGSHSMMRSLLELYSQETKHFHQCPNAEVQMPLK